MKGSVTGESIYNVLFSQASAKGNIDIIYRTLPAHILLLIILFKSTTPPIERKQYANYTIVTSNKQTTPIVAAVCNSERSRLIVQ